MITNSSVEVLLQEYKARLEPLFTKRDPGHLPPIEVNLNRRMRSVLGRAYIDENRIELNYRLLEKYPQELAPTLAHELAHLIAPRLYGRQGLFHRDGWKKVMDHLGFAPVRTHSLNVEEFKVKQKVLGWATCGCPGRQHPIRSRILKRMRRRYRYACLKCKQELKLKGAELR